MAVKAVNDSAGPNGLVPTLLVFRAYPRISRDNIPPALLVKRADAVRIAIQEVRRLHARRSV